MVLDRVEIRGFRNISKADLGLGRGLNVVAGDNAAGKTSLLEAIHVLAHGKTFRRRDLDGVIQHGNDGFLIFGLVKKGVGDVRGIAMGIGRSKGRTEMRVSGCAVDSRAELARSLPFLLIHPGRHVLMEGGPKFRREFLNWGVFHVEHSFYGAWRGFQRALKQRNVLLRSGAREKELVVWERELSARGCEIDELMGEYVRRLAPRIVGYATEMLDVPEVTVSYRRGWAGTGDLEGALAACRERDVERGFTSCGPHRADLSLQVGGNAASEALSRGQQKLLVVALFLAQASTLKESNGHGCVIGIDDFPSELDTAHRTKVMGLLSKLGLQVLATATDAAGIPASDWDQANMFHVEHGEITVA